jgi:methylmalonyl-CoA carboxyltransferase large subunit
VELNVADFVVLAVLVGAGCALSFYGLWLVLRQALSQHQQGVESQLRALAGALKTLEARMAESNRPAAAAPVVEAVAGTAAPAQGEVTPEVLVMIAAAVTAYLGRKVRIRSAKLLRPPSEVVNAWSQQGRVMVHSSHNLRFRG